MITLAYPYASPTDSVELPNPILGDSNQLDIKVNLKHSMSGAMVTTIRTPVTDKFILDFQLLSESEKVDLEAFLTSYAGQDIKYTDWHDPANEYKVKILNAPILFKSRKDGYTFTLELTTVGA